MIVILTFTDNPGLRYLHPEDVVRQLGNATDKEKLDICNKLLAPQLS